MGNEFRGSFTEVAEQASQVFGRCMAYHRHADAVIRGGNSMSFKERLGSNRLRSNVFDEFEFFFGHFPGRRCHFHGQAHEPNTVVEHQCNDDGDEDRMEVDMVQATEVRWGSKVCKEPFTLFPQFTLDVYLVDATTIERRAKFPLIEEVPKPFEQGRYIIGFAAW